MNASTLNLYSELDALSPSAQALLDRVGKSRLFTSRPWFESFIAAGLSGDTKPLFFVLEDGAGRAEAILPCQQMNSSSQMDDIAIASLTSFYSCDFRPLIATEADPAATAFALGRALARRLADEAVVRFDSLAADLPILKPLLSGLSVPGRAMLRYDQFGRWSQTVAGSTFDDYLAGRDGALREVLRRRGGKLGREGAHFTMIGHGLACDTSDAIERGIADYEAVYAQSWKEPEPFPAFQPTLMRALSDAGWLRLALCHIGERPIAAQLWASVAGHATVLKLAHDKAFDALSPGTALTAYAIADLMEREAVATLDFGRGDDAYKRAWTTRRTQHIGILWTSIARRPLLIARHFLGRLALKTRAKR